MRRLVLDFGREKNYSQELVKKAMDKYNRLFQGNEDSEKCFVIITKTDEVGIIDSVEAIVFNSYSAALETINANEYALRTTVAVYMCNKDSFVHILYKCFDGCNYSRLAQPKHHNIADEAMFKVRYFYDTDAKVSVEF